ncbi:MAG: transposase [Deltaproteobacteria bacterium]|nr:transposase [Deltaproteobacteria bacterium]
MGRPLRIEYDGAWYHVMNRGLARRRIFVVDKDYRNFFVLLKEVTQTYKIQVHAFSLMPNHYHLLIHTPVAGLKTAMQFLDAVYTRRFNRIHGRDGPLFRGRYKSVLVDSNEYLTSLVRYIHLNPVKARLCLNPKQHQWTSHKYYLKTIKGFEWLCTDNVLNEYGKSLTHARKRFAESLSLELNDDTIKEIEKPRHNIIGGQFFKEWINGNFIDKKTIATRDIAIKDKILRPKITGEQILENIAFCYNIKVPEIITCKPGQKNEARSMAVYLMRNRLGYSLKQIGKWLKTENEFAVAQVLFRIKKKIEIDKRFVKKVREIEHAVLR